MLPKVSKNTLRLSSWEREGLPVEGFLGIPLWESRKTGHLHGDSDCRWLTQELSHPRPCTLQSLDSELCLSCWTDGLVGEAYDLAYAGDRVEFVIETMERVRSLPDDVRSFVMYHQLFTELPVDHETAAGWARRVDVELREVYSAHFAPLRQDLSGEPCEEGILHLGDRETGRLLSQLAAEDLHLIAAWWEPENAPRLLLRAPLDLVEWLHERMVPFQPDWGTLSCASLRGVTPEVLETALVLLDGESEHLWSISNALEVALSV